MLQKRKKLSQLCSLSKVHDPGEKQRDKKITSCKTAYFIVGV